MYFVLLITLLIPFLQLLLYHVLLPRSPLNDTHLAGSLREKRNIAILEVLKQDPGFEYREMKGQVLGFGQPNLGFEANLALDARQTAATHPRISTPTTTPM